jgi:gluconate 2-dehydrogenase gamma chain
VRFIDRFLSGDYVYASADGEGFLQLSGPAAVAWRARISDLQGTYRNGVRELDGIAGRDFSADFKELEEDRQDSVLEVLSGSPRPGRLTQQSRPTQGTQLMVFFDDDLSFFDVLVGHTRQGYYGDPVYGGNRNRVGWETIGFPGPDSLGDTVNGAYGVAEFFEPVFDWADLIPHLREQSQRR